MDTSVIVHRWSRCTVYRTSSMYQAVAARIRCNVATWFTSLISSVCLYVSHVTIVALTRRLTRCSTSFCAMTLRWTQTFVTVAVWVFKDGVVTSTRRAPIPHRRPSSAPRRPPSPSVVFAVSGRRRAAGGAVGAAVTASTRRPDRRLSVVRLHTTASRRKMCSSR